MRDPIPPFGRRRLSERTSAAVLYLVEVVARAYEPTDTELAELDRSYESTSQFLVECPELEGFFEQVHAHGSRQLGTLTRAVDPAREGCDIDLAVRLAAGAWHRFNPAQLLNRVGGALERYADRYGLEIKRSERCITLTYAGGITADFAPIIDDPNLHALYGEFHARIPDRERRGYLPTNPRGFCFMFEAATKIVPRFSLRETVAKAYAEIRGQEVLPLPDAEEIFGRLLCRFVQGAKIHRNVAFHGSEELRRLRPSSIFLTTLLLIAYEIEAPKLHDGPLDLMLDMVELIPSLFGRQPRPGGGETWSLPNPTAPGDDLAASMNEPGKQAAFSNWHAALRRDLQRLLDAVEDNTGLDDVLNIVESSFGERARAAVERYARNRREAVRGAGRAAGIVGATLSLTGVARANTHFGQS